ncbi:hypothetical protein ACLOJK_014638 [Asimina triloba]
MSTQFAVHRRSTNFGALSPSPRSAAIAAGGELQRDIRSTITTDDRCPFFSNAGQQLRSSQATHHPDHSRLECHPIHLHPPTVRISIPSRHPSPAADNAPSPTVTETATTQRPSTMIQRPPTTRTISAIRPALTHHDQTMAASSSRPSRGPAHDPTSQHAITAHLHPNLHLSSYK